MKFQTIAMISARACHAVGAALVGGLVALTPAQGQVLAPVLLMDAATGQVLHAEDATRPWHPASTTKLMTAYVALRALRSGTVKLETPLIASGRASAQPPSKIGIRPGQEITLDNALKILMVKSANDLAVVIAEGIGGSVEGFAGMMNAEARRLGMRESQFVNPHGLHDASQQSSARDLALLAQALLSEFPEYGAYWGIGAVQLGQRVMKNTNGLIGRYPGASGMKTGFICPSGFNVVATARRGGRTLIAVVLGAGSAAERTVRTAQLFDRGFQGGGLFALGGSGGGTVQSLASSGYASAPNMRQEICRKGRRIPLGEEESDAAISFTAVGDEALSPTSFFLGTSGNAPLTGGSSARRVGSRAPSGRVVLGPREPLETIQVYLGRAPGSTEVARGPGVRPAATDVAKALPPATQAFTATAPAAGAPSGAAPVAEAATSNLGAIPRRESAPTPAAASAPLALPGAITSGRTTAVAPSRPASAASIRARPAPQATGDIAVPAAPEPATASVQALPNEARTAAPPPPPRARPGKTKAGKSDASKTKTGKRKNGQKQAAVSARDLTAT